MTHIFTHRHLARFLVLACGWTIASQAMAHPGHGHTEAHQIAHYAIEPIHALPWLIVVLGAATYLATQFIRSRTNRCQDE